MIIKRNKTIIKVILLFISKKDKILLKSTILDKTLPIILIPITKPNIINLPFIAPYLNINGYNIDTTNTHANIEPINEENISFKTIDSLK